MGKRKRSLEIYIKFGHAPSKRFASPALQEVTWEGDELHTLSTANKVFFCIRHKRMPGITGIGQPILKLGTRWNYQLHVPALYLHGKSPWYPLNRFLNGPQGRCRRIAEERNFFPCRETNHDFAALHWLRYPGWRQCVVILVVLTSRWDRRTTNTHCRHGRRTGIQTARQEIRRDERKCRWEDATKTGPKMKLRLRMWCGLKLRTHYWKL